MVIHLEEGFHDALVIPLGFMLAHVNIACTDDLVRIQDPLLHIALGEGKFREPHMVIRNVFWKVRSTVYRFLHEGYISQSLCAVPQFFIIPGQVLP